MDNFEYKRQLLGISIKWRNRTGTLENARIESWRVSQRASGRQKEVLYVTRETVWAVTSHCRCTHSLLYLHVHVLRAVVVQSLLCSSILGLTSFTASNRNLLDFPRPLNFPRTDLTQFALPPSWSDACERHAGVWLAVVNGASVRMASLAGRVTV